VEADARAWVSVEPDAPNGYFLLAEALASRGAPRDAVSATLARAIDVAAADERELVDAAYGAGVAIFYGEFDRAVPLLEAWKKAVDKKTRVDSSQATPMLGMSQLFEEAGQKDRAIQTAEGFLSMAASLGRDPLELDPTIAFSGVLLREGRLSAASFEQIRATWSKAQLDRLKQQEATRSSPFQVWLDGYGALAHDKASAEAALANQGDFGSVPTWVQRSAALFTLGKVQALAEHYEDALPYLRNAAASCVALTKPIAQTHAQYFLAVTLEHQGDVDGARAAYQVVVDRWGNSTPASVTAEAAKKALERLNPQ
jgi:tetratricopeptide (TPR) repeat protein